MFKKSQLQRTPTPSFFFANGKTTRKMTLIWHANPEQMALSSQ